MRLHLYGSLEHFLEQVARRGSWVGGGSVAALSAALAAALLEKLVVRPSAGRRPGAIRRQCLSLVPQDAERFAQVIQATRRKDRRRFVLALKRATEVQCRVFRHAQAIEAACRAAQRSVKPKFQSDLRCAMAMAMAASESARALIHTNAAWLGDRAYSRRIRHVLQEAGRHGRASSR